MSCQNNGIISRFVLCAALALSVGIPPSLAFSQANKTSPASMKGVLLIQWSDETRFIYVSPADNPLRFTTRIGREVKPGRMYTDGGSIPRVFWWVLAMGLRPRLCSARLAISSTSLPTR
jgi:hypothetical protein